MNSTSWTLVIIAGIALVSVLVLLIFIRRDVRALVNSGANTFSHFRYIHGRDEFNTIGIEIVNGAVENDTLTLIMRSGTFAEPFAEVLVKFRGHNNTRLLVIVPERQVFVANCREELKELVTGLYENPNCAGLRAMALTPDNSQSSRRMGMGYLFISDGHIHSEDDGFVTETAESYNFLLTTMNSFIESGEQVKI